MEKSVRFLSATITYSIKEGRIACRSPQEVGAVVEVKFGVYSIRFGARSASENSLVLHPLLIASPFSLSFFYRSSGHSAARENPDSLAYVRRLCGNATHRLAVRSFRIHRDTPRERERENAVIRRLARRGTTCDTRALHDQTRRACCVETVARAHARLSLTPILERGVI